MLELGRREQSLLSGLVVQVLVVGMLVFAYTQAARQLKFQRSLFLELKEQLARARDQVERAGPRDLAEMQARLFELESQMATPETLSDWAGRVEIFARDRFSFRNLQVKVGAPVKTIPVPVSPHSQFEMKLQPLELQGSGTTREAAGLLESLSPLSVKFLCPLERMELKAQAADASLPVELYFRWLVATGTKIAGSADQKVKPKPWPVTSAAEGRWGSREEPFRSPFSNPHAFQIPGSTIARFHLTGIVWDPVSPSCVINGIPLKPGELLDGYKLVLLTPRAVILSKPYEEIYLSLP